MSKVFLAMSDVFLAMFWGVFGIVGQVLLNLCGQPYLDVLREIEADNYTMRIAASRSFRIFRLEGSNP